MYRCKFEALLRLPPRPPPSTAPPEQSVSQPAGVHYSCAPPAGRPRHRRLNGARAAAPTAAIARLSSGRPTVDRTHASPNAIPVMPQLTHHKLLPSAITSM